jgi:hypothetical protein
MSEVGREKMTLTIIFLFINSETASKERIRVI